MKKVGDILLKLGVLPNLKGFNYTIDLVEMINKGEVAKITAAYEIAGKKNGDSGASVERAIRHVVDKIDTATEEYENILGINNKGKNVTNSEFLYTLAYRVKEE